VYFLVKTQIQKPYKKHIGSHVAGHHEWVHHDNLAFQVKYQDNHNLFSTKPLAITPATPFGGSYKKSQIQSMPPANLARKMSQLPNPYCKQPPTVTTEDKDNVSMRDNSPSLKNSTSNDSKHKQDEAKQADDRSPSSKQSNTEEGMDFDDQPFQIPPSFGQPITEETLHDNKCPYVLWASLHLPVPKDPGNLMAAIYNALEEFVMQLVDEDPNFIVYP